MRVLILICGTAAIVLTPLPFLLNGNDLQLPLGASFTWADVNILIWALACAALVFATMTAAQRRQWTWWAVLVTLLGYLLGGPILLALIATMRVPVPWTWENELDYVLTTSVICAAFGRAGLAGAAAVAYGIVGFSSRSPRQQVINAGSTSHIARARSMATLVRWCAFTACALLALGFGVDAVRTGALCAGDCPQDYGGPALLSLALFAPGILLSLLTWSLWARELMHVGDTAGARVVLVYAGFVLTLVALVILLFNGGTQIPSTFIGMVDLQVGLLGASLVLQGYMLVTLVKVLGPYAFLAPPKQR